MSVFFLVLLGLMIGVVFGVALEKSRVFEPGILIGQFQMRNFTMLKVFLSAVVTGLAVLSAMSALGLVDLHPKAAIVGSTLVGGLIFGAGIILSGACPGTVMAQIGAGYKDSWAVLVGGVFGAMAFGYFSQPINAILKQINFGKITLADLMSMPFEVLALGFALVLVVVLILLERIQPWRDGMGIDGDGLEIGQHKDAS